MNEKQNLSRKLILEALKEYKGLFNKPPSDSDLETYAKMLCAQFEYRQVTWALTEYVKSGSAFFPSCGEIFAKLTPDLEKKEDRAPLIVKEIINAIRSFGQYDEARMLESVSEDARLVFLAIGNTSDIRNSENFETTNAQLERLAKGVLASKEAGQKVLQLKRVGIAPKNESMKALNFSDFQPKDLA